TVLGGAFADVQAPMAPSSVMRQAPWRRRRSLRSEALEAEDLEIEGGAGVPVSVARFAEQLGGGWSSKRKGAPSAAALRDWLVKDYATTIAGARKRFKQRYGSGHYTAEAITRAWMTSRREQMLFQTSSPGNIKPLHAFAPPRTTVALVSDASVRDSRT